MRDNTSSNKRIARNTGMLYIRMFVMMAVTLFTSRIVLQVLGAEDYGIYNIIGGVVVLFSFLNTALTQATQRFLNFTLGKNDNKATHTVFCMSINAYILLAILFLIGAETVGLWFVDTQLNIPSHRMGAALWVYHFSVITFIINLIRVPYNASIIAYEQMDFFAYLSLLEVSLKLIIVYLLWISPWDKLIVYAFMYTLVTLLITILYKIYCNHHFDITRYKVIWDKGLFKKLFSFSGWSLFGSLANLGANQGLNILVNIFYGVTVNAAMGIANQVSGAVTQFFSNFQTAFSPQIVKDYAAGEYEKLNKLIFSSAKFSFYLMFVISLPLILEMENVLDIWLVDVPPYTAIFTDLILVFMMLEALSGPLWMYVQATGQIRNYQILMSALIALNLPIVFIVLKIGWPVYWVWIIRILVDILVIVVRCIYVKRKFAFPSERFVYMVFLPVLLVTILSLPLPILAKNVISGYWTGIIATTCISVVVSPIVIYAVGMNSYEKDFIRKTVIAKLARNERENS